MAQYTIKNKTEREYTKDGVTKKYLSADLVDETGNEFKGVGAFNGEFAADVWHGTLEKNDKGYWKLVSPKNLANQNYTNNKKEELIRGAQDRKAGMIKDAQERKELSIAFFNSTNVAIDFVKTFYAHPSIVSPSEAWDKVVEYREKFFKEWQKFNAMDESDKTLPF